MKYACSVVLLLLGFFLMACGGATTPSTSSAATTTPPSSASGATGNTPSAPDGPTVLHVTRTDPSATNNIGPLDKTVTDVPTVQNLYQMAQKLPAYPTGSSLSQNCLNDLGVIYHLDFLQGSSEIQRMNLDPGECRVLFVSQTDLRQVSDAFLHLLQQALQVNSLTSN